jgi:hypothetical protein
MHTKLISQKFERKGINSSYNISFSDLVQDVNEILWLIMGQKNKFSFKVCSNYII